MLNDPTKTYKEEDVANSRIIKSISDSRTFVRTQRYDTTVSTQSELTVSDTHTRTPMRASQHTHEHNSQSCTMHTKIKSINYIRNSTYYLLCSIKTHDYTSYFCLAHDRNLSPFQSNKRNTPQKATKEMTCASNMYYT